MIIINGDFLCRNLTGIEKFAFEICKHLDNLIEKNQMFKYAYAPKGFLIDYSDKSLVEEFTKLIKEYLNKKKIMAIKINPMIVRSSYDYRTNITHINPVFEEQLEFLKSFKECMEKLK